MPQVRYGNPIGGDGEQFQGTWFLMERTLHINVLETYTVQKAIRLLGFRNGTLVVWTDNAVAISVVQKLGSHSQALQLIAGLMLEELAGRNIQVLPRHIVGKQNVVAEALSRVHTIEAE